MPTVDLTPGSAKSCLAVLLPGRFGGPESFEKAGFADAVAERGLALDLVAADAHLGYYRTRSVVDRLRADVIGPAQEAGYEQIWLVGTSLGGVGSLLYLRDHPDDLSGVVVLAPFLGADDVIREIEDAGGPLAWSPPAVIGPRDVGRELWSWLAPWASGDEAVPLYLGWGTDDDFDRANRLLAGLLPEERVFTTSGGHDWMVWSRLWGEFLDQAELSSCGRT